MRTHGHHAEPDAFIFTHLHT